MPPIIFVADDAESLRRKLAPFVRSTSEPIIEESYRGFNIIRLRHDVIAVKQSLGAVDLSRPLEQLARQFDADDFMTDTDLGALRVRIAEAAGRRNTRAIFGELQAQIERMKEEHNASVKQLREQLVAVQENLTVAIENAPSRRAMRAMRRLLGWGTSDKASQDVRASADESASGGL